MSERKTPCSTYKVEYVCDMCKDGVMEPSGKTIVIDPPEYVHVCNSCGNKDSFLIRYPEIRCKPIKAPQIDLDAFEEHMKRQAEMQLYRVDEQGNPVRSDIRRILGEKE